MTLEKAILPNKPLMYDLCCGEGGVAQVALDLGWRVIGLDIIPQPNYPGEFILADALNPPLRPGADLVWSSPPCQGYSKFIYNPSLKTTPRIVNEIRQVARALAPHYIIENIPGCYDLINPIRLCGYMFGLQLIRHRLFETSFLVPQPPHFKHGDAWVQVAGHGRGILSKWRDAMGFPSMSKHGLTQAVPYAYTNYILSWFNTRN